MPPRGRPYTEDSSAFDPDALFDLWDSSTLTSAKDLRSVIIAAFNLPANDDYTYHATASVTLAQVQAALDAGSANGLLAWYKDENGNEQDPPPQADVAAYTSIFSSQTSTAKSLTSFAANAKKGSIRTAISSHLQSHFHPPSSPPLTLPAAKKSKASTLPATSNPYLDVWAWTCHALNWAGPTPSTAALTHSHAVLPVLYHHFGCVVPSSDAVHVLRQLSSLPGVQGVVDLGSGNGYWTAILRRNGINVRCVDSGEANWRTCWVGDTIRADAPAWLRQRDVSGAREEVALLVYPVLARDFTRSVLAAFRGKWAVLAATQCRNGFTAFRDCTVKEWTEGEDEEGTKWERVAQVPLPSFAGKDEALFVLKRREVG